MGKGVFIPEAILALAGLTSTEKMVLALVIAFNNKGCYQSNRNLATFLGCGVTTIKRAIKGLKAKGYVYDIEVAKLKRCLKPHRATCALSTGGEIGPNAPQDRAKMDPEQGRNGPIDGAKMGLQIKEERELKEKSKENYSPDCDEFRLATLLFGCIRSRKPDLKKPNLQGWAQHVDYMVRLDDRKPERIEAVINWCQQDDFWQNNILSTRKLREHFDKLELKMESKHGRTTAHRRDFSEQQSSIGTVVAV
jgi:biotin operon repressor